MEVAKPVIRNYTNVLPLLKKAVADSRRWNVQDFLSRPGTTTVSFLNAHGVNIGVVNEEFTSFLCSSTYLLRDGIGVKLALRALGMENTENLNGTDLIPQIIAQYKDRRIAIFGTSDAALTACRDRLEQDGFTQVVSLIDGFQTHDIYLAAVETHRPEIIILCLGMPRQELLAAKLGAAAGLVICGGGWADFYSGVTSRAPLWVRRFSLEWVYRLLTEPKRLGKRYTVDLFVFFLNIHRGKRPG